MDKTRYMLRLMTVAVTRLITKILKWKYLQLRLWLKIWNIYSCIRTSQMYFYSYMIHIAYKLLSFGNNGL